RATGRTLSAWQRERGSPGMALSWVVLLPPRDVLRAAVSERWQRMLEQGALLEVERLLARRLERTLPVMKAVGVAELETVLQGEASLEAASRCAIDRTRQYLKRQTTWLRTQVLAGRQDALVLEEKFSEVVRQAVFNKIPLKGLTT